METHDHSGRSGTSGLSGRCDHVERARQRTLRERLRRRLAQARIGALSVHGDDKERDVKRPCALHYSLDTSPCFPPKTFYRWHFTDVARLVVAAVEAFGVRC